MGTKPIPGSVALKIPIDSLPLHQLALSPTLKLDLVKQRRQLCDCGTQVDIWEKVLTIMMIAFITISSGLVPWIEGLSAHKRSNLGIKI